MKKLAKRIFEFLEKYAAISPNWKRGDSCEDNKYTSPDAYEMLRCANELNKGIIPSKCWSEWGSGGYKPYTSKEGYGEHEFLVREIYKLITSS